MSEHARCNKVTVVIAAGALTWCAASLTHCAQKNEEQKAAPAKGNASSLEKGEARPSAKVPRKSSPSFTPPDRELLIVRLEHGRPRNLLRVHSHDPRTGATTRVFDSSRTKKLGVDRYTAVCRGGDVFVTGYAAKANRGSDADASVGSTASRPTGRMKPRPCCVSKSPT
jgi:hypothetical protein